MGVSPNAEIPLHTYRTRQHTHHPTPNTQHTHTQHTMMEVIANTRTQVRRASINITYQLHTSATTSTHPERERKADTHTHTQSESTSKSTKAVRPESKRTYINNTYRVTHIDIEIYTERYIVYKDRFTSITRRTYT